jgi:hypothetical protein
MGLFARSLVEHGLESWDMPSILLVRETIQKSLARWQEQIEHDKATIALLDAEIVRRTSRVGPYR